MPSENIIIVNDEAQATLSLKYSEEKLRTIIASSSDYIIQLDDKLNIQTLCGQMAVGNKDPFDIILEQYQLSSSLSSI